MVIFNRLPFFELPFNGCAYFYSSLLLFLIVCFALRAWYLDVLGYGWLIGYFVDLSIWIPYVPLFRYLVFLGLIVFFRFCCFGVSVVVVGRPSSSHTHREGVIIGVTRLSSILAKIARLWAECSPKGVPIFAAWAKRMRSYPHVASSSFLVCCFLSFQEERFEVRSLKECLFVGF